MSIPRSNQFSTPNTEAQSTQSEIYLNVEITDSLGEVSTIAVEDEILADVLWAYAVKAYQFHMNRPELISAEVDTFNCSFTINTCYEGERFYDLFAKHIFNFLKKHYTIEADIIEIVLKADRKSPIF